jgi:hypothetical protein
MEIEMAVDQERILSLRFLDNQAPLETASRWKVLIQDADANISSFEVSKEYAWTVARAVAVQHECVTVVHGRLARARFKPDGSGHVQWNSNSETPRKVMEFGVDGFLQI